MAAENLPVQVACRVLGVAESGYYEHRKRTPLERSIRHAMLTEPDHPDPRRVPPDLRRPADPRRAHPGPRGRGRAPPGRAADASRGPAGPVWAAEVETGSGPTTSPATASSVSSPAPGLTSSGSPTSPSTPPERARSTAAPCSTPTPAASWAGRSTPHRRARRSPTPSAWPSTPASASTPSPARSSTPITGSNTSRWPTPRAARGRHRRLDRHRRRRPGQRVVRVDHRAVQDRSDQPRSTRLARPQRGRVAGRPLGALVQHRKLHSFIGHLPPTEYEDRHRQGTTATPIPEGSVTGRVFPAAFISRFLLPGQRSAKVVANAFSAGFHLMVHRAWPFPVGSNDRVTR